MQTLACYSTPPRSLSCPQRKRGQKEKVETKYPINHVQLIGFLGKDPEKRQARGNGENFTVPSVATQQSWKDSNDEWQSKTEWHRVVVIWNQARSQFQAAPEVSKQAFLIHGQLKT